MKNWFVKLSSTYKAAFISTLVILAAFLSLIFGYFNELADIPNGVLAGGLIGILSLVFKGLAEKADAKRQKPIWTIVVSVSRYLLIGILIVVSAILQYQFGYKIFNLFNTRS